MRKIALIVSGAMVLMAGGFAPAQLPPPQDAAELDRELGIMAKVIEDSLDRSGLEGWHWVRGSVSAFEPRVKYEYYPSIGAVFTIPVSFPVIDHSADAEPENAPEPPKEPDLWERHSRAEPETIETAPLEIPDSLPGIIAESITQAVTTATEFAVDPWGTKYHRYEVHGSQNYDESKLNQLRLVLLEAVAKYGYRIEHLPADEKIVLAVEAPGGRGTRSHPSNAFIHITPPPGRNADVPDIAPIPQIAPAPATPPEQPEPPREMSRERRELERELAEAENELAEGLAEMQSDFEEEMEDARSELEEAIRDGEVDNPDEARERLERRVESMRTDLQRRQELVKRAHERRIRSSREGVDRRDRVQRDVRVKRIAPMPFNVIHSSVNSDRYVIVVEKNDVREPVTVEELAQKVREFRKTQ